MTQQEETAATAAERLAQTPAPSPDRFDANERAAKQSRPVLIGETEYRTKRSGKAMEKILLELTPSSEEEDSDDPQTRVKTMNLMYDQARVLLVREAPGQVRECTVCGIKRATHEHPEADELEEMDFEVVRDLVAFIWGREAQRELARELRALSAGDEDGQGNGQVPDIVGRLDEINESLVAQMPDEALSSVKERLEAEQMRRLTDGEPSPAAPSSPTQPAAETSSPNGDADSEVSPERPEATMLSPSPAASESGGDS